MTLLDSEAVQPDFIKMRWLEPYVSAGLNRKTFKSLPRGVYSGFVVRPVPSSASVTVKHNDPEGFGEVSGFSEGSFDPASSGWSVAVHSSLDGYNATIAILDAPGGANDFTFDLDAYRGQTVFIVLDVQYKLGFGSESQVKVVEAADLDADPALINLARVDVPSTGDVEQGNIINDDAVYPRVLPFANKLKYGFMSKFQVGLLEEIANVSGTPAFVSEYIAPVDGPQTVPLPSGSRYTVGGDDLWVFKNGNKKRKGVDYLEVNRGDGFGDEISWVGTIREGDVIEFRVQEFSSVLTSRTQVFDENALISDNAHYYNFTGTGVTVIPDGTNRVRVVVPGGGASNLVRTKINDTGSLIPSYRAVSILSDNTIRPFDTSVSGESFYGITLQDIPNAVSGDVQIDGMVSCAGMGIAGSIGNDVYISQDNDGSMTTEVPSALSGQVIRVGKLDADGATTTPEDIFFDRGRMA